MGMYLYKGSRASRVLHREPWPVLGSSEAVPGLPSSLKCGSATLGQAHISPGFAGTPLARSLSLQLTLLSVPAQAPLSRLLVPVLLALGWILGCALMVYIVFS